MITPEYLSEIVRATEARVSVLHEYLIGRIAKHIASFLGAKENIEVLPSDITKMHQMMESGRVYEDIQKELEKNYPKIQEEIKTAFLNSAAEISKANTKFEKDIVKAENLDVKVPDYDINGIPKSAKDLNLTDHEVRLLEADYRRTNGTVKNLTKTTANSSQKIFIEACDEAMIKVQHGTSPALAITEAIKSVADKGIGVVLYGNKRTNIEIAIARAVRTGVNQANADIVLQRCAELGVGYVKVSEHLGARVTNTKDYKDHAWWQGQVYKLNWKDSPLKGYTHEAEGHIKEIADAIGEVKADYPNFVSTTGYGDILGLCGANCRHTFSAFYPNIQSDPEPRIDYAESKKRYAEEQKARALERDIRKTKRELEALQGSGLAQVPEVQKQLQDTQNKLDKQIENYYDYCRKHRMNADGSRMVVSNGNLAETKVKVLAQSEAKKANKIEITDDAIDKVPKLDISDYTKQECDIIQQKHKEVLEYAKNANNSNEVLSISPTRGLNAKAVLIKGTIDSIDPSDDIRAAVMARKNPIRGLLWVHNHPKLETFSMADLAAFTKSEIKTFSIVTNSGKIYILNKLNGFDEQRYYSAMLEKFKEWNNETRVVEYMLKNSKMFNVEYIK